MWSIVALAFLCVVVVPLLSKLTTLLVIVLIAAGLFFIGPVIARAVIAGLVARFKQAVIFRVVSQAGGVASDTRSQSGEVLQNAVPGRGKVREADVIEVEAVAEENRATAAAGNRRS